MTQERRCLCGNRITIEKYDKYVWQCDCGVYWTIKPLPNLDLVKRTEYLREHRPITT